jgi:hypothetical protein
VWRSSIFQTISGLTEAEVEPLLVSMYGSDSTVSRVLADRTVSRVLADRTISRVLVL